MTDTTFSIFDLNENELYTDKINQFNSTEKQPSKISLNSNYAHGPPPGLPQPIPQADDYHFQNAASIDDKKLRKLAKQLNNLGVLDDDETGQNKENQPTKSQITPKSPYDYDEGIANSSLNDSHTSAMFSNSKSPGKSPLSLDSSGYYTSSMPSSRHQQYRDHTYNNNSTKNLNTSNTYSTGPGTQMGPHNNFHHSQASMQNYSNTFDSYNNSSNTSPRNSNASPISSVHQHHTLPNNDNSIVASLQEMAEKQRKINDKVQAELDKTKTISEKVLVPSSEHVAEIVGKQGCKIKALRTKTSTYIKTPVRGEDPYFVITGHKVDVEKAVKEIQEAADHFTEIRLQRSRQAALGVGPGNNNEKVIDGAIHKIDQNGKIISPGKIIAPIGPPEKDLNVDVRNRYHVPNSVCRDLHRTVSPGSDEELKMSNYMNFDRTKKGSGNVAAPVFGGYSLDNIDPDLLAKQVTVKVRVPLSVVGLVVGPRGSKIKHIQNFTQTYIVTPSRNKDPVFEITGLKENVAKAREEIESWIAVRTGSDVIEDVDPLDEFKMNGSEKNLEEDDAKFDSFRPEPSSNLPTNFTERNLIHQNPLRSKLELANHSTTENTRHPSSSTTDSYQDEEESKNQAILALQNLTDKEKIRLGEVIEQFKHEKKNKIQAPPVTQKLAVGTRQPLTKKELNNPTIMPIFEPKKKKNVSTDNVLISKLDPEAEKNRDRRADNFNSKLYNKSQPASLGHFSMDKIVQNSDQPGKRLLQKVAMGENNSPENYPADPRYPGYSPRAPYHPDGYGYEPYDPYYGAPRGPMPPSHAYGYPPAGNYGYPPHPHHAYGAGYGYPPAHPYPPHPYGYPEHAADPNYYPPESHGPYGMPGYNYDHSGHYGYESGPPGTHRGDSARLHPKKSEKLPIKPAENLNKSVDSKTSHKNSTGISISSIEFHPASSTPLSAITDNLEKSEDAISDVNSMGNLPASKTLTLTQEADSFTTVKGVSKAGKCLVCREQPISMALVPCGHNLFCEDCAYMITQGNKKNLSDNNPVCPECFEPVNMAIRIKM